MVTPRITARANKRIRSLEQIAKLSRRDMDTMTRDVDKEFRRAEKRLFSSEGSSGGRKWRKLTAKYARAKRRAVGAKKIMQRSGRLRRSLVNKGHGHVARHERFVIKVGTRNPVAGYHGAGGGGRQNPRLPKRDVMQMTQRQRRRYHGIVRTYLVKTKLERVRRALRAGAVR